MASKTVAIRGSGAMRVYFDGRRDALDLSGGAGKIMLF